MAAPKAQDMSVRDEDTLAQDQSLDRLQASMKKTLGFDGGPTGLVHMDTSELHQFMGELGEKMAQHDRLVVSPPWLEHLQAKLGALEGEVTSLRGTVKAQEAELKDYARRAAATARAGAVAAAPAPAFPDGDFGDNESSDGDDAGPRRATTADLEELEKRLMLECVAYPEMEKRLMALHESVTRTDEVAKLDVKAQLVTFSIDLERMRKTVEIAPSVGELTALKDMYGGKLKALKTFLNEKLTSIERDIRLESSSESMRIENTVIEKEVKNTEEMETMKEQIRVLQEELEFLRDDNQKQSGVLDARISDNQTTFEGQLAEVKGQNDKLKEIQALAQSLEKNQDSMAHREAELMGLIGDNRSKNEGTVSQIQGDVTFLKSLIDGNTNQFKQLKEEANELESRVDGIEVTLDQAQKRSMANNAKLKETEKRTSQLEADLEAIKTSDLADITTGLDAFKEEVKMKDEAVQNALTEHQTQMDTTASKLAKAEQEVYHVIPPKLNEQDMIIAALKNQVEEHKTSQDEWNEKTTDHMTEVEEKTTIELADLSGNGKQNTLAIGGLEADLAATKHTVSRDQEHMRGVESTVGQNHGVISKAVDVLKTDAERRFQHQEAQLGSEIGKLRDQMKDLFNSMEHEMSSKIKHSHNSPIHLSAEDQKQHLRNQASALAKISIRFEQQSHEKGKPAKELPRDMCRTISLVTQEMADYIAQKADVWAIEQTIHGAPEDHPYSDSTIETRRQRIFQNFMELVSEEITRRYPDAGSIRQDARAMTIRKIQVAIEMALSKFDQVTVVGNSRLLARRLDVPKCVTCDRPLYNRKNPYKDIGKLQDTPIIEGLSRPESSAAYTNPPTELGFHGTRPATSERRSPHYQKQLRNQEINKQRLQEAGTGGRPKAVMRGGFRMPKGQLSEEIQMRMTPNVIEAQRSLDSQDEQDPLMMQTSASLPNLNPSR
ncbi:hypothetical protein AURANDRAFT_65929 [Aureococcus anophagefferens]|uniref:Uncharacterized protein n=2 Tax=Aureococcus anophagefferens TaxID=44056 RepID=F0YFQ3_AURAN|nr:hypothetical protein AURANDRAFT_65929 [Aureococcus anophagefferens]EGB05968.1 hypothetical protein AURANDRAFT_65929 [Aureococcus anophagefferens]|eukprot:XP_009039228.1 hypothetical protein AURANDRAFT_65929 [Aureococcus anophagefferens]